MLKHGVNVQLSSLVIVGLERPKIDGGRKGEMPRLVAPLPIDHVKNECGEQKQSEIA